jgi:hypothetical protein
MAYDPDAGSAGPPAPIARAGVPYDPDAPTESILKKSFAQVPSKESEGNLWESNKHAFGVGVRDVVQGRIGGMADFLSMPLRAAGLPGDKPSELIDKAGSLLPPWLYSKPETPQEEKFSGPNQALAGLIPLGPKTPSPPVTMTPRMAGYGKAAEAVVNPMATVPGAATSIPRIATTAGSTVAGEQGGKAAADLIPESSPYAFLKPLAALAGGIGASGAANTVASGAERLINAGTGKLNEVAQAYARQNMTPPTVGSVTGTTTAEGAEAAMSKLPGSAGQIRTAVRNATDEFGAKVDDVSAGLHYNATNEPGVLPTMGRAGDVAQNELRKWRFETFPAERDVAFAPMNGRMAQAYVDPSGFRRSLSQGAVEDALKDLPETQRVLGRQQMQKLLDAFNADREPGSPITWEQANALRQRIGDMRGTPEFIQGMGDAALTKIYGGIASDMERAAENNGMGRLFREANEHSTKGYNFLSRVAGKAVETNNPNQDIAPEVAAQRLLNLKGSELTELRQRSPAAADALAAAKLQEMKLATPGVATEPNETSINRFLTNLNAMRNSNPDGYRALFADPKVRRTIEDLGAIAGRGRETSKLVNTSNTTPTAIMSSLLTGGLAGGAGMALAGIPGLGALALPALPYLIAKGINTNPAMIKALSGQRSQPKAPAGLLGTIGNIPAIGG